MLLHVIFAVLKTWVGSQQGALLVPMVFKVGGKVVGSSSASEIEVGRAELVHDRNWLLVFRSN